MTESSKLEPAAIHSTAAAPARHGRKLPTESTIDWTRLKTFLTVAQCQTFTRAGRTLNLSQSAVSRQIGMLEEELQTALFLRTPKGLVLTEPGQDFLKTVQAVGNKLAMGISRINEWREKPEGPLRITTSCAFGSGWLARRISKFHEAYPGSELSLLLVDELEMDLLVGEADCALRFARQKDPNLVQRHLMKIRYHVFASQSYLDRYGTPETIEDLNDHQIIIYGNAVRAPVTDANWLLTHNMAPGQTRKAVLTINSVAGICRAVESGLGIAALPSYVLDEAPDLVEVLHDLEAPFFEVSFVYPEELKHSRRIQALRDFLVAEAKRDKYKCRCSYC